MFHIAMFGCAHLGYSPAGLRRKLPDGTNVVAADGYVAHRQTITEICQTAENLTGSTIMVDGGDLFHSPHPSPEAIDVALSCDQLRVSAGIERFSIPGNHDRSSASATPATAVLRNSPGSHIIAPTHWAVEPAALDPRQEVVCDGLYEIWHFNADSEQPGPPIHLHFINEQALSPTAEDMDPAVDPHPISRGVNILITHGIVPDPTRHFVQADERGGNRVIPADWFHRGFTFALLSDFHTPAADTFRGGTSWAYTGSAVRRGFSDAEVARGWLLCTIDDEGRASLEFHGIAQRPAIDKQVILPENPVSAVELITGLLAEIAPRAVDSASGERTGDAGVRIRIIAMAPSTEVFEATTAMIAKWSKELPEALSVEIRVQAEDHPHDLPSALNMVPSVGEETPVEALHRMTEADLLPSFTALPPTQRPAALDAASAALLT